MYTKRGIWHSLCVMPPIICNIFFVQLLNIADNKFLCEFRALTFERICRSDVTGFFFTNVCQLPKYHRFVQIPRQCEEAV